MSKIYRKNEYIIIPVQGEHLVVNTDKVFREGHINVKRFDIATLLIDLAINKELPIKTKFVDSLARISVDKNYIDRLKEFREDNEELNIKRLMKASVYRRHRGAIRQFR